MQNPPLTLTQKRRRGEIRWFTQTDDGFDGTAGGYGYKTPEKLYAAYWFFKNQDKILALKAEARKYLKDNDDVSFALRSYFHPDNCFYRLKDGEDSSIKNFIKESADDGLSKIADKLNTVKHLWKSMEIHFLK
jgi:hypothetical protein